MTITAETLVAREVHYCVSSLVATLASCWGVDHVNEDMDALHEQAQELCYPIEDWVSAATDNGWHGLDNDEDSARQFCEDENLDPYQNEVFEHWIVSDWLADHLAKRGEKVDKDFAGMTIWARTTTGQGIASDYVIDDILRELVAASV
jgi:hypothetical protein